MSAIRENTVYLLKENVTGAENGECRFRFVREGENLRFFFDVDDDEIVSPFAADNENIYEGDAVEVFLSPDGDLTFYKELEVSPYGVRFYGNIRSDGVKNGALEKIPPAFRAKTALRKGGWRAEIELPLSALIGFDPDKARMNAFRLDKRADGDQRLYALNPTLCGSFHRPAFFLGISR